MNCLFCNAYRLVYNAPRPPMPGSTYHCLHAHMAFRYSICLHFVHGGAQSYWRRHVEQWNEIAVVRMVLVTAWRFYDARIIFATRRRCDAVLRWSQHGRSGIARYTMNKFTVGIRDHLFSTVYTTLHFITTLIKPTPYLFPSCCGSVTPYGAYNGINNNGQRRYGHVPVEGQGSAVCSGVIPPCSPATPTRSACSGCRTARSPTLGFSLARYNLSSAPKRFGTVLSAGCVGLVFIPFTVVLRSLRICSRMVKKSVIPAPWHGTLATFHHTHTMAPISITSPHV